MIKNFSESESLTGQLTQVVWRAIQSEVVKRLQKFEQLMALCYPEANLKLECSIDEVLNFFTELAKAQ